MLVVRLLDCCYAVAVAVATAAVMTLDDAHLLLSGCACGCACAAGPAGCGCCGCYRTAVASRPAQQVGCNCVRDGMRAKGRVELWALTVAAGGLEKKAASVLNLVVLGSGASAASTFLGFSFTLAFLSIVVALGLRPAPGL